MFLPTTGQKNKMKTQHLTHLIMLEFVTANVLARTAYTFTRHRSALALVWGSVSVHVMNVSSIFTLPLPLFWSAHKTSGSLAAKCSAMFTSESQTLSI